MYVRVRNEIREEVVVTSHLDIIFEILEEIKNYIERKRKGCLLYFSGIREIRKLCR